MYKIYIEKTKEIQYYVVAEVLYRTSRSNFDSSVPVELCPFEIFPMTVGPEPPGGGGLEIGGCFLLVAAG